MNTEHIDIGLARYSDWAFTTSVVVLVAPCCCSRWSWRTAAAARSSSGSRSGAGVHPGPAAGPGIVVDSAAADRRRADRRRWACADLRRYRPAAGLHRAAWPGHLAGAVGQHVRVHQPDLLLGSGGRRHRVAASPVPRAVGFRACSGADSADGVGSLALHERRAGHARPPVLLVAHPRVGGQSRLGGVPRRRRCQHPVPAQDVEVWRARTPMARSRGSWSGCPTRRPWTESPTAPRSSRSRCSGSASSSARSGPRKHGVDTGAGTRRRRWRSSHG